MAKRTHLRPGCRLVQIVLVSALLAGCAGEQMHREGMELVRTGHVEEGLAKLSDASRAAPDNLTYKTDLLRTREDAARGWIAMADSERAGGRDDSAQALYERALKADPGNALAMHGLELVAANRKHNAAMDKADALLKAGDVHGAQALVKTVLMEDSKNSRALDLRKRIDDLSMKALEAEPQLSEKFNKPVSLQFRDANLKMVFEALSRTSGINILLDKDVRPDLKTSIFVQNTSVEDTINLILMQNQLAKKIISDNTVFVYPDTPAKRNEYQELKIRSFHLTHADPKQVLTMIKTLLKTKDIFINEKTNSIVMRDTPEAIQLAEKLVTDQDVQGPEVMLEVQVLEVTRTHMSELGISWPDAFGIATPSTVNTLADLKSMKWSSVTVTPLSAALAFHLDEGDTRVLASPRIRVRNREKAKIMVGSRVPVITNSVTPLANSSSVVTGQVQYLDVGLKLEVEPDILLDNEVVIKLSMDVSSIIKQINDAQSGTVAYEIGTRNANTVLRLKDGETDVLGGLIDDEDRKTSVEVPGLGKVPILGYLFGDHTDDKTKTEIVLSITPHVIGNALPPDVTDEEYWTGTEENLSTTPFTMKSQGTISVATSSPSIPAVSSWRDRLEQAQRATTQAHLAALQSKEGQAVVAGTAAAQAAQPMALTWQGPGQVKPGDTVRLTLNAQSAQPVKDLDLKVNFDPTVFKAIDATEGGFLMQGSPPATFNKTIDQASGSVDVNVTGNGTGGVSGSGGVVTLVLQALAASSSSQIAVSQASPVGPGGDPVPVAAPEPFSITVSP
ncbi:MAG TPA: secretin N-terminal domain-containing protein [Parasulfuritortus sp.]